MDGASEHGISIGETIKRNRILGGYTQGDIANALNISRCKYGLKEADKQSFTLYEYLRVRNIFDIN
jgi:transcriptional regulator with XRE-family HTH domain